jgi:hypothetical protein
MFDNFFALAGPVVTAGLLVTTLFTVVGVCRLGARLPPSSRSH